jgi:hypothetical protein
MESTAYTRGAPVADDRDMSDKLQTLETHQTAMDARLSGVERTLVSHTAKLDRIVDSIAAASGKPQFDPVLVISFVKDVAILFGLVCAGIIYVASNITASGNAVLSHRVQQLERLSSPPIIRDLKQ